MAVSEASGIPANPYNPHAWLIGDPEIGEGCWIGAFCVIDGSGGLTIGDGCDVSSGVHIYTHSTVARCVSGRALPIERRATTIGSRVHIGANAVILMGCEIGDGSIVAAGAIVKEGTRAPAGSLLVGVPARVIPDAALKFDASRNPSVDS
ncbi:acyltransferase [Agromyces sp. NPDC058126]|uniref:acyltransferase n=1 Tax=Agromyces sp. NPDC058126 TaxID=3346350 RepID=UPI0036DA4BFB